MNRFNQVSKFAVPWLAVAIVWLTSSAQGCWQEKLEVPFKVTGRTMGPIVYNVVIAHHPETVTPEELQTEIQATLDRVNALMSTYISDSDVSRFNNSDSVDFISVSAETALVVRRAIEISHATGGAFDITVGPAVNLWNFGPNKSEFKPPQDSEVEKVQQFVGFAKLTVREDPPAIKKSEPGLQIDLSAIAKGYAVDQVGLALQNLGCQKFMVEVGGEVTTFGERFDGGPWRIAIESPTQNKNDPQGAWKDVAAISNQGMATSGDYRNFVKHEGKRYSHAIDPKTCRPVTHALASACIVFDDCMTADAIATAVTVLGAEQGIKVCEKLGVEFLILERDSDFGMNFNRSSSSKFPLANLEKKVAASDAVKGESIWPVFFAATVIFGMVILAMAVGSIFAGKPVSGSCGGLANVTNEDGETSCGICSKPSTDCVEQQETETQSS